MRSFVLGILMSFVVALFFVSASAAQENIIIDPGFEKSPHVPWTEWKDWGPGKRDFDNTEKIRSGNQSYKVVITDSASRWNSEIALQEDITDIQAGDKFEASAYVLVPEDKTLSKHVEVYLEVIFRDGKGKNEENEVGKFQSKKYVLGKPQDQWVKLTISDVAPQGTKECKLQFVVLPLPYLADEQKEKESYSGTVYFDDVNLINKSRVLR